MLRFSERQEVRETLAYGGIFVGSAIGLLCGTSAIGRASLYQQRLVHVWEDWRERLAGEGAMQLARDQLRELELRETASLVWLGYLGTNFSLLSISSAPIRFLVQYPRPKTAVAPHALLSIVR